jgi:hypothetical protein
MVRDAERPETGALFDVTHPLGWELRLMLDGHGLGLMSSVVRSAGEMITTADKWRAAMTERGWIE